MRRLTQLGPRPGHRLRAGTVALGVRTQDEILRRVLTLEVVRVATRRGESTQVESWRGYLPGKSGCGGSGGRGIQNVGRCAMPAHGARSQRMNLCGD